MFSKFFSSSRLNNFLISAGAVSGIFLAGLPFAAAAAQVWIGGSDSHWNTGSNWDSTVPNAIGDTAVFNSNLADITNAMLTLDNGTVALGSLQVLGNDATASRITFSNGSFIFNSGGLGDALLSVDKNALVIFDADITLAGNLTIANAVGSQGSITINGAVNIGSSTLAVNSSDSSGIVSINGTVSNNGTGSIVKLGAGTLALSGDNSEFAGSITIHQGTLLAANSTYTHFSLGTTSSIVFDNDASAAGRLLFQGDNDTFFGRISVNANSVGSIEAGAGAHFELQNAPDQDYGYAVTVGANGTLNVVGDVTFSNLTGYLGGAISADINSVLNFSNAGSIIFSKNLADDSGGAIYIASGEAIFGNNAQFMFNTASSGIGGAIYAETGIIKFGNDAAFVGNLSSGYDMNGSDGGGGAIAVYSNSIVSFEERAKFQGNSANGSGGAVYLREGTLTFGDSAYFANNTSGSNGGAIAIGNTEYEYDMVGMLTLGTNAAFISNTAQGNGGAISVANSNSTITIGTGAKFTGNSAGRSGGAIYTEGAMTVGANVSFINNAAWLQGGAILTFQTLEIGDNVTLSGNIVGRTGSPVYQVLGGAIYAGGNVKIGTNATITDNHAAVGGTVMHGGAIFGNGNVEIGSGAVISGNSTDRFGGAIYASGTLSLAGNTRVENNSSANVANGKGGAFVVSGGFNLVLNAGEYFTATGNKAALNTNGGFLYLLGGNASFNIAAGATATIGNTTSIANGTDSISAASANQLNKAGAGTLTLWAANTYTGNTNVSGGTLVLNGSIASALTTVASGATLAGTGTSTGAVRVQNGGTLAPGNSPGTLTVASLTLDSGSNSNFEFGKANTMGGAYNDLVNVTGNLSLGGALNVTIPTAPADFAFTYGVYRVFNYGGTLANPNGLKLGSMPTPNSGQNYYIQTSVNKQVNLVYLDEKNDPFALNGKMMYWDGQKNADGSNRNDGIVQGGTGTWQAWGNVGNNGVWGNDNWTTADGVINAPWQDYNYAMFSNTGGTVTVDNTLGQVTASGATFSANNYVITGGSILLGGSTISTFNVTANVTATINSVLTGDNVQFLKVGNGTLNLNANNTYTGGAEIQQGTLVISANGALGTGTLSFSAPSSSNVTLRTIGDLTLGNNITTGASSYVGTLNDTGNTTLNGKISGHGIINKVGATTLTSNGSNDYHGTVNINAGTLNLAGSSGAVDGTTNIGTGATLIGTGTLGGDINIAAGATFRPGNNGTSLTTGTFTAQNVTLASGAEIVFNLKSTSDYSKLVLNGGVFTTDGALLTLLLDDSYTLQEHDRFDIVKGASAIAANTSFLYGVQTLGDLSIFSINGNEFQLRYNLDPGTVSLLATTAVPEPSTYGIFGAVALIGAIALRRHKRR